MAKAGKKSRSERAEDAPLSRAGGAGPASDSATAEETFRPVLSLVKNGSAKSALAVAFWYHEQGDQPRSREFAQKVLAAEPTFDDIDVAKTLAPLLKGERLVGSSPHEVAQELILLSKVPPKPYLFAALAAGVMAVLIAIALLRT